MFGTEGIVFAPFSGVAYGGVGEVLVQGDGKIVVIGTGTIQSPTGGDLLVMRFNWDGSQDTSFGDVDLGNPLQRKGYTLVDLGGINDNGSSGALLPDGRIVAGGYNLSDTNTNAVVRLNNDGSIDPSFGLGGKIVIPVASLWLQDMAVDSVGRIILGGGEPNYTAVRLNANGDLDTSFGSGGFASVPPTSASNGGYGLSRALVLQPNGAGGERIVVGGWAKKKAGDNAAFGLVGFTPSGTLDLSFGTGGRATGAFSEGSSQIHGLAVDTEYKIVAAGTATPSCAATDVAYARFNSNGSLDTLFSGDGKLTLDVYDGSDSGRSVVIQGDGKIVVSGNAVTNETPTSSHFLLTRLNPNGTFDASFGTGLTGFFGRGVVTTDVANNAAGYRVGLQTDGSIVVAGPASAGSSNFAIARYLP